jgi:hypothetical protein
VAIPHSTTPAMYVPQDPSARPSAETLLRHPWVVAHRRTLRSTWSTARKARAERGREEAPPGVASVIEAILERETEAGEHVEDLGSGGTEQQQQQPSPGGSSDQPDRSGPGEGSARKEELAAQTQREFEAAVSEDPVGTSLLEAFEQLALGAPPPLLARPPAGREQDVAEVRRQVASLHVPGGAADRSIVQEAAAAASARALIPYVASDPMLKVRRFLFLLLLLPVPDCGDKAIWSCPASHGATNYFLMQLVFLAADGISGVRELLDSPSERVLGTAFDLLLSLVAGDQQCLEAACALGMLPAALRYGAQLNAVELRLQAAAFAALLCRASETTARDFVACQGVPFLVAMIDDTPRVRVCCWLEVNACLFIGRSIHNSSPSSHCAVHPSAGAGLHRGVLLPGAAPPCSSHQGSGPTKSAPAADGAPRSVATACEGASLGTEALGNGAAAGTHCQKQWQRSIAQQGLSNASSASWVRGLHVVFVFNIS